MIHASLKEERLLTGPCFAQVARRRGILFLPPRPPVVAMLKEIRYDEFQLIADSYNCARPNMERYLSEAHTRVKRRHRTGGRGGGGAEHAIDHDNLKAFQSQKVKLEGHLKERAPAEQSETWQTYIALVEWAHKLFKMREMMGEEYSVTSVFTPYIDDAMKNIIMADSPSAPGTPASEMQES